MKKILYFLFICFLSNFSYSQKGKHGDQTISGSNIILNSYSPLNQNAQSGDLTINTNLNNLINGFFTTPVEEGDLLLIIQIQGALIDVNTYPTVGWGGNYTVPNVYFSASWGTNPWEWGQVLNYNNCGKFEQIEVESISGTNQINLSCPLQNDYDISGKVQIIRVPRLNNLSLPANTSISCPNWNGTTGGIVCLEVDGQLDINSNAKISSSEKGFRGGISDNIGLPGSLNICTTGAGNGCTALGSNSNPEGGRKGEGIAGYTNEYSSIYSIYGTGAPANGGGGGGWHNAGGGGGSNVGNGTYNGRGVPNTAYNAAWNQEYPGFANSTSAGGGRGGYSFSESNQNANVTGPNNVAWSGDARKPNGGLGGHPLTYDSTRVFIGGGGGAGDQDSDQGGSGGKGGGIVMITSYGNIIGAGKIESNGQEGENSNPNNEQVFFGKKGNDGAGGGGAGGTIYIKNTQAIPNTITLEAKGGKGGNHNLTYLFGQTPEGSGPGGGGGGGAISYSNGIPVSNITGGSSGVTNSLDLTEFPPNGSTAGDVGNINNASSYFNILINDTTICTASSVTLNAIVLGYTSGTLNWYDQAFGGNPIQTGNSFTTPVINSTTTYYIGICPGTFRDSVTISIGSTPIISGTANIINSTCGNPGSISGLLASGATPPYSYSWNGQNSATIDLINAIPGNYTLIVSDSAGCSATSGPYSIQGFSSPTIDSTNFSVTPEICNGTLGSINGIIASGSVLTYNWTNGGGNTLNAQNLNSGSYSLTVSDSNGCTISTGPYIINYIAGPIVDTSLLNISNSNCDKSNGSISGISASGSGLSYYWTPGGLTSANIDSLQPGSYNLIIIDSNSCSINIGPYLISAYSGPQIDTTQLIINDVTCLNPFGSINGLSISGSYSQITWSDPSLTILNPSTLTPGNYDLIVNDSVGCADTLNILITNFPEPSLDSSNINVIQPNCNQDGSINMLNINGGTSPISIVWIGTNQTTLDIQNLSPGNYSIFIEDSIGCKDSLLNITILTPPSIDADFTFNPQNPQLNETVIFTNISSGNFINSEWLIDGQNFLIYEPTYSFSLSGDYPVTLIISDSNSCVDSVTYFISIINEIKIPNIFSPNSDNSNDYFEILGLFPNSTLLIYNRWGTLVYESKDYDNLWNGTDQTGNDLIEGVYTYLFIDHKNEKHHGFVNLVK